MVMKARMIDANLRPWDSRVAVPWLSPEHFRSRAALHKVGAPMSLRSLRYGFVALLLFGSINCAADDLKVVVLDSKDGHALRGKLVCIMLPANPRDPVILEQSRVCHRTDSGGTAL